MNYKVLKEHDSHFVVHDGESEFKVAKKGLSKDLISKIQNYPKHYDEGGTVTPDQPDAMSLDLGSRAPASDGPTMFGFGSSGDSKGPGMMDSLANAFDLSKTPQLPQTPAAQPEFKVNPDGTLDLGGLNVAPNGTVSRDIAAAPQAPSQPAAQQMPMAKDPMTSAIGGYQSALNNVAKQQGDLANKQADVQQKYIDNMQAAQAAHTEELGKISAENDNLFQSIQNEKVDPNRLWNSAGTGNKITASIGLILGGLGAGMGHTQNAALQVMQNAIDRDVDAQKTEIGKKQNLLQFNMQKYRNAELAESATRLQLATTANAQMQKAALESGSPMAQAQAKLAGQQMMLQYAPMMQQMALMRISNQAMTNGVPAQSAHDQILLQLDPKYKEERVEVNGNAYRSNTPKEAEELRKSAGLFDHVQSQLQQLKQLNTLGSRISPEQRATAQSVSKQLGMDINELNGYNRFTDVDEKTIHSQFDDPNAWSTIFNNNAGTNALLRGMQNKMEGRFQNQLLGYKGMKGMNFNPGTSGTLPLNKGR